MDGMKNKDFSVEPLFMISVDPIIMHCIVFTENFCPIASKRILYGENVIKKLLENGPMSLSKRITNNFV